MSLIKASAELYEAQKRADKARGAFEYMCLIGTAKRYEVGLDTVYVVKAGNGLYEAYIVHQFETRKSSQHSKLEKAVYELYDYPYGSITLQQA